MIDGFIRVAAATPEIKTADCKYNGEQILSLMKKACDGGASAVVFPELCVTGYTCGDLFGQTLLLQKAEETLLMLASATKEMKIIAIVGLPVRYGAKLYNCGAVLGNGKILGLIPKQNIPNYSEFYEARHFSSGKGISGVVTIGGKAVPFGSLTFRCRELPEFCFGAEICEDLWVPIPPSAALAEKGAVVIFNLSASDEVIGKKNYRRELVKGQSARLVCGYVYADAGQGESTTDLVFSGHNLIAENGSLLAESTPFTTGITYGEIDLSKLTEEKRRMGTFPSNPAEENHIEFSLPVKELSLNRKFPPHPFIPEDSDHLQERCEEILAIQVQGLFSRMKHIGAKNAVIGLSGGLDSTLALIVTVRAFDLLGLDRKGILTVTMPCFGTTRRTKSNAELLAKAYGTKFREIPISDSVTQHFKDIGQNPETCDVTYENAQARERTQILMDLANQNGGLVIGTGDLSELALGWATYNGDHMSMYAVNASVPKTLVRHLTAYEASLAPKETAKVLLDILDTPVSPELLPPKNGEISQKTEDLVGPYEIHDFYLYYFLRYGFPPKKLLRIAKLAFEGIYSEETLLYWLKVFLRRFFTQQFKRSCLPDGPKVGSVALSPRGDWRMPSDASYSLWLEELNQL